MITNRVGVGEAVLAASAGWVNDVADDGGAWASAGNLLVFAQVGC